MYEKEKIITWFDSREHFGTYCHTLERDGEDVFVVEASDVADFGDFLEEQYPDVAYIPCKVGKGGIWFSSEDLDDAVSY